MSNPRVMVIASDKLSILSKLLQTRLAAGQRTQPFGLVIVNEDENDDKFQQQLCKASLPENVAAVSFQKVLSAGKSAMLQLSSSNRTTNSEAALDYCVERLRKFVNVNTDWVALYHSSGTTGLPKGVMHSHFTLLAGNLICKLVILKKICRIR